MIDDIDSCLQEYGGDLRGFSEDPKERIEHWLGIPAKIVEPLTITDRQRAALNAIDGDTYYGSESEYDFFWRGSVTETVEGYIEREKLEHDSLKKCLENNDSFEDASYAPACLCVLCTGAGYNTTQVETRLFSEMRVSVSVVGEQLESFARQLTRAFTDGLWTEAEFRANSVAGLSTSGAFIDEVSGNVRPPNTIMIEHTTGDSPNVQFINTDNIEGTYIDQIGFSAESEIEQNSTSIRALQDFQTTSIAP